MVDLNPLGLAADFELILDLGMLDAATDVGQGEGDFFAFENDSLLFRRRRYGLDGEAGSVHRGHPRCRRQTLLQCLFTGTDLVLRGFVFAGVIDVCCEQAAAEGEDHPSFSIVHGGVVGKLEVG